MKMVKQIKHFALISLFALSSSLLAAVNSDAAKSSPVVGLGVVVEDIQRATEHYNSLLGINIWEMVDVNTEQGAVRIARGMIKGKSIELLQPLYGDSLASEFLNSHGPGLFHLELKRNFSIKHAKKIDSAEAENNFIQAPESPYAMTWFDTYKTLGVYIKQTNRDVTEKDFWGLKTLIPQQIPLTNSFVQQLGIVVKDAEATAKEWQKIIGLKPWVFVDFKPPMTSNGQYLGAKGSAYSHVHVAYGQLQDLQIELLEPVAGPTPHRDYLRVRGQGAHHISLGRVKSHDELSEYYQKLGLAVQMQSDNGGDGRTATYMATEQELAWVIELTRPFTGLGSLKIVKTLGMPKPKGSH